MHLKNNPFIAMYRNLTGFSLLVAVAKSGSAGLALAVLALAIPSHSNAATGFTGPFTLTNDTNTSKWVFSANTSLSTTFTTSFPCDFDPGVQSCLDWGEAEDGLVRIGAGYNSLGPEVAETILTWPNSSSITGYTVSFTISCPECTNSNIVEYSVAGTSGTTFGTLYTGNISAPVTAYIGSDTIIEFKIKNADNTEGLNVQIADFNYVPSPLPATGAAAAFGYSRRLRRRIKGEPGSASRRKRLKPAHPSSYLSLTPAAVETLPLSFHYSKAGLAADANRPERVTAA